MQIKRKKFLPRIILNIANNLNIKARFFYMSIAALNIAIISKNWFEIFKNYSDKNNDKKLVKLRNGIKLEFEGNADLSMLTETWALEYYNPKGFEINKTDTVIDIGAHVGFFSVYAANKASKGIVYSYEPFIKNFMHLKNNAKINNLKNLKTYNYAVSNTVTNKKLFVNLEHNGCHSLYVRGNKSTQKIVHTITLKKIFEDNKISKCDFLKIDCEGSEYEILINSKNDVLSKIKKISGELHPDIIGKNKIRGIKKHLEKNGFDVLITKDYMFYAKNIKNN